MFKVTQAVFRTDGVHIECPRGMEDLPNDAIATSSAGVAHERAIERARIFGGVAIVTIASEVIGGTETAVCLLSWPHIDSETPRWAERGRAHVVEIAPATELLPDANKALVGGES